MGEAPVISIAEQDDAWWTDFQPEREHQGVNPNELCNTTAQSRMKIPFEAPERTANAAAHGTCGCHGLLFNHESAMRGEAFALRKIPHALARSIPRLQDMEHLGNLSAGHSVGSCQGLYGSAVRYISTGRVGSPFPDRDFVTADAAPGIDHQD